MSRCEHGVDDYHRCFSCYPISEDDLGERDEKIKNLEERVDALEKQVAALVKPYFKRACMMNGGG